MRWFFKITKIIIVILVISVITVISLAFGRFNNIFVRDEGLKKIESNDKAGTKPVPGNTEGVGEGVDNNNGDNKDIIGVEPQNDKNSIQSGDGNVRKETGEGTYFLTLDEIVSIENLSFSDKLTGLTILSKLGKSDADKLLGIARGGITQSEYAEIRSILEDVLSEKDINKLNDILKRNKKLYAEGKPDR